MTFDACFLKELKSHMRILQFSLYTLYVQIDRQLHKLYNKTSYSTFLKFLLLNLTKFNTHDHKQSRL